MSPRNVTNELFQTFSELAIVCLKHQLPFYAEKFCHFLVELRRVGAWEQFQPLDRERWLDQLEGLLGPKALGDALHDPDDQTDYKASDLVKSIRRAMKQAT
jgi:hypothetical protein